jgi:hypothetical protein
LRPWDSRPQKKGEHGRVGEHELPFVALEALTGAKRGLMIGWIPPRVAIITGNASATFWQSALGPHGACPDASCRSESYHVLLYAQGYKRVTMP